MRVVGGGEVCVVSGGEVGGGGGQITAERL